MKLLKPLYLKSHLNKLHQNTIKRFPCKTKNVNVTKCILSDQVVFSVPEYITPSSSKQAIVHLPLLTAPSLKNSSDEWNYTTFLNKVIHNEVVSVKISQDQKNITVKFKNNSEKSLILPEGYDIITFLLQYNIQIHIETSKKPPPELSVLDISLIICQCVFLYFVLKTILNKRPKSNETLTNSVISPVNLINSNNLSSIHSNIGISTDINTDPNLEIAAYRESGQLISNIFINNLDAIESVSIDENNRNNANLSQENNVVATNLKQNRQNLEDRLKIILGGRVAEEIIFGALRSSSGKSSDIEIAIQLAYDIIATYGFSQSVGITEWDNLNTPYLQQNIEKIVKRIIKRAYKDVRKFIIKNKQLLDDIASELLKKKTLYKEDINALILKSYKSSRILNRKFIKHLNTKNNKAIYNNDKQSK
jgi:ATP-dependent Zn protease